MPKPEEKDLFTMKAISFRLPRHSLSPIEVRMQGSDVILTQDYETQAGEKKRLTGRFKRPPSGFSAPISFDLALALPALPE
jgi:hypothetical protein